MDFAEASEGESMEFAASSSLDTDSDLDFAQSSEKSAHPLSSEEEESSEKGKTSSGMEFAESSAAETDSDMEFGNRLGMKCVKICNSSPNKKFDYLCFKSLKDFSDEVSKI